MQVWRTRQVVLLLMAMSAVLYGYGLTHQGLTNWQESQRALVAREMQERIAAARDGRELLEAIVVPTAVGRAYLAKPPMMYWAQVGLASVLGKRTSEFELRAVVAVSGMLGVLATYWCVLVLLSPGRGGDRGVYATVWAGAPESVPRGSERAWARSAAMWSALCVMTGVLYVRSSRIGELDILLVPGVVLGIGGVARSWRRHIERGETDVIGILIATIGATAAVMTKGPAGLAVIAMGAYGGMGVWAALTREPMETFLMPRFRLPGGRVVPGFETPKIERGGETARGIVWGASLMTGAAAGGYSIARVESAGDFVGAVMHGVAAGLLGAVVARLMQPVRLKAYWAALTRTHPVGVLGVPLVVFAAWWRLVEGAIGADAARSAALGEAEDNLRWFSPGAMIVNVEALAYGVGLGSIAGMIAVVWVLKDRPRVRPGWVVVLAWVVMGTWIFAVSTKGVVRYLTPVWPAVAMLAGMWISTRVMESRSPARIRACFGAVIGAMFVVQAWWYGDGRAIYFADRSPRALVGEAIERFGLDADRLATYELRTPAIDYYVGRRVEAVGEIGMRESMSGVVPMTLDGLARRIRDEGKPMGVFLRVSGPDALGRRDLKPAADRLVEAGFTVSMLNTSSRFVTDSGRSVVGVAVVDVTK